MRQDLRHVLKVLGNARTSTLANEQACDALFGAVGKVALDLTPPRRETRPAM